MKTGRVRKKAEPTTPPREEADRAKPAAKPKSSPPKTPSRPSGTAGKKLKTPYLVFGILGAIFVCFVIVMIVMTLRGRADEWIEVSRANGSWTTTVTVFGPQVKVEERWEADCTGDVNGTVQVSTCVMKDTDTYQDNVVDDYEEYAYNIYYEETWDKTYQAQGTEFVVTALGGDDWWEGNLHYTLEEELDKDSCQYTNYTLWVDDPQDSSQEAEVYLAECEVWDHVVVTERVYDQRSWCQCDVTTLVEMGQQSEQGGGSNVLWPNPNVPAGGSTERAFKGQVTFLGDDYTYTATTDDLARYQDYLTGQYYIGLNDGKPMTVSKNPKD
jgi:hypothetical protein